MTTVLGLMAVQGLMGAFDTLYFHEYRARLPAGGARTRPELWLHALRDFVYAILFCTLPWVAWAGALAWVLGLLIAVEIGLTMADFVVEKRARAPHDLAPGERVTHGLMAIVYGAMLGHLWPIAVRWSTEPLGFAAHSTPVPLPLAAVLTLMGVGVFASGLRDAYAALGLPGGARPWG